MAHRVWTGALTDGAIREALSFVEWERLIPAGARVALKPNLTWREPMAGVTTTPAFIRGVVQALVERTSRITIVESDGGYHAFKAEEAFASHGLYELAQRHGIHVRNLSAGPAAPRTVEIDGRPVTVELPRLLLEETDVFITLPVPKVHVMTQVSLGFKNQWGCQPGTMRLRNHPEFVTKILAIHRALAPRLALYDGTYFLDRTGPMVGEAVPMGLLVAADDVGAGDLVCCTIMDVEPRRVAHLRLAQRLGLMPRTLAEIRLNLAPETLPRRAFRMQRTLINYVALAAFHSNALTRLFYDSTAADPMHRVLYAIRRNRLVGRLLYGPTGPPAAEGRR
jgi:uncharacterized protein (DUF362 family)